MKNLSKRTKNLTCTTFFKLLQQPNKPKRLKEYFVLFLILVFGNGIAFQTFSQIAYQGFEQSASNTWPVNFSTPPCTSGSDIWDYVNNISGVGPSVASQYWGIADLDGNCGSSSFETITTSNYDVSGCTGVTVSFDYYCFEFDNGDDIKYQLIYDGSPQAEVVIVNGNSNFSTGGWLTETITIPAGTNNVQLIISVKQNGGGDYGGIDNIILDGSCVSCSPATEPTVAPSASSVTNIDCYTADLSWTNGSGSNSIVILSTSPVSNPPSDLSGYAANASYGSGSNTGGADYVIYDGSGTNVSISGLSHSTTFYYAIYTYNVTSPNCDENYLTASVETGTFTTLTCTSTCPYISSIMFNSCGGSEGLDEYWTFETGSDPINIDDMVVDYPNQQYCNSGCPDGGLINNQPHIDDLNATAGCSPDLFVYADPIPPNSTVIVFTGNPPSTVLDFSPNCNAAPVYVIFTENNSISGRFANSAVRDLTVDFGGSCSETVTYDGNQAGNDGGTVNYDVNGNPTYSTSTACVYPLPLTLLTFALNEDDEGVNLQWQTASETDVSQYYINHSIDGENWVMIGSVKPKGTKASANNYNYHHPSPGNGINYYQLKAQDHNGITYKVSTKSIEIKNSSSVDIKYYQGEIQIFSNTSLKGGTIQVFDVSGQPLHQERLYHDFKNKISPHDWTQGIYLIQVKTKEGFQYTEKVFIH